MNMNANIRAHRLALAVLSLVSFGALAQAASDEKPTPSIYDQYPDCMNRGQVAPGQPAPCELAAPPSGRRAIVAPGSNVSQTAALQNSPVGPAAAPAPVGSPSNMAQGQGATGRVRAR